MIYKAILTIYFFNGIWANWLKENRICYSGTCLCVVNISYKFSCLPWDPASHLVIFYDAHRSLELSSTLLWRRKFLDFLRRYVKEKEKENLTVNPCILVLWISLYCSWIRYHGVKIDLQSLSPSSKLQRTICLRCLWSEKKEKEMYRTSILITSLPGIRKRKAWVTAKTSI